MTYVIYLGLLFSCWYFPGRVEKTKNIWYLYLTAFLMTVVAGLRGTSVGIDTEGYYQLIELIGEGHPEYAYGLEKGFKFLCALVLRVWNNPTVVVCLMAGFTNFLILKRFWDFRESASMPVMVFCYLTQFFFFSLNGMRQMLAVAIVFYATRYLEKGKLIKFFLLIVFSGIFIHNSAWLGVIYFFFDIFQWRNFSKKKKQFYGLLIMAVPFLAVLAIRKLSVYVDYLDNISVSIGILVPLKVAVFLAALLLKNDFKIKFHPGRNHIRTDSALMSMGMVGLYYFLGLIGSGLGYFILFADRVSLYFYVFEAVFWGTLLSKRGTHFKYRQLFLLAIVVLQGYKFLSVFRGSGQGVVPYEFIWQTMGH